MDVKEITFTFTPIILCDGWHDISDDRDCLTHDKIIVTIDMQVLEQHSEVAELRAIYYYMKLNYHSKVLPSVTILCILFH